MTTKSQLVWAASAGIAINAVAAGVGTFEKLNAINILFVPGMLLAAVFFPQGIEGNYGYLYLVLAAIINVLLFGLIVLFIIRMRSKSSLSHGKA